MRRASEVFFRLAWVVIIAGAGWRQCAFATEAGGSSMPSLSSWVVYWDKGKSLQAFDQSGLHFEELSVFAVDFGPRFQLSPSKEVIKALRKLERVDASHRPLVLLTVVNDVQSPGNSHLKDAEIVHRSIFTSSERSAHIDRLMELSAGADGVEIDYESLWLKDREAFSLFIRDLAERLHRRRQSLSVDVEYKTADQGAIDWKEVGQYADLVKVEEYSFHVPSGTAGPLAPFDWVGQVTRFALSEIPSNKLCVILTLNGCDWSRNGHGRPLGYEEAMKLEEKYHAPHQWDPGSASPYFRYTKNGAVHQVWFEDAESLKEKVKLLQTMGISHIGLWHLGAGDPEFWSWLKTGS
jgi:spore germination protein YaaH